MLEFSVDKLKVKISDTRVEMGNTAGRDIASALRRLLKTKNQVNVIFAAAPSQNETLSALIAEDDIDWTRVNALHMDEYIGLGPDDSRRFGEYLKSAIFGRLPFGNVFYIDGGAQDADAECKRYGALLEKYPPDIVCMGIGENGHIAFNDPPVADFNDQHAVKPVTLDEVCRLQQVHDGCFEKLSDVPKIALTLTVPSLFNASELFCSVPSSTKANAVKAMLTGEISEKCPASILRRHDCAVLYCDADSSALISNKDFK